MILNVSVSELRGNFSQYLERVSRGSRVLIRDEKRNVTIAQISQVIPFDKDSYEKVLRKVSGTLKSESHPEWNTKEDIIDWVRKNRLSNDREF
jgi:antitoxin (DNA-binding transcriptional repressor) of toxin-antitoxin stability system